MKNKFLSSLFVMSVFLVFFLSVVSSGSSSVNASPFEEKIYREKDFVLESASPGNVYFASSSLDVEKTVNGDLVGAASKIIVDAPVYDDLVVAGNEIYVGATIGGDVRAAGRTVVFDSAVFGDFVALGADIYLGDNSTVGKDLIIYGGSVTINGVVNGDVRIRASNVFINGVILGDAEIDAQNLEMGSSSSIKGNLNLFRKVELDESKVEGVVVQGKVNPAPFSTYAVGLIGTLTFLVFLLVVGLFLVLVGKGFTERSVIVAVKKPAGSFLLGLAALIVIPFLCAALFISIIGIPLAFVLGLAYLLLLFVGLVVGAMAVGRLIYVLFDKKPSMAMCVVVGSIAFVLVSLIPILGGLFLIFFLLLGIGSAFRSIFFKKNVRRTKK